MDLDEQIWAEKCFIWKVAFGIGPFWRKLEEIGQRISTLIQKPSQLNQIKQKSIKLSKLEQKSALYEKLHFFKKNQLGIGPLSRKWEEVGQKWISEPLFSEI